MATQGRSVGDCHRDLSTPVTAYCVRVCGACALCTRVQRARVYRRARFIIKRRATKRRAKLQYDSKSYARVRRRCFYATRVLAERRGRVTVRVSSGQRVFSPSGYRSFDGLFRVNCAIMSVQGMAFAAAAAAVETRRATCAAGIISFVRRTCSVPRRRTYHNNNYHILPRSERII